MIETGLVCDLQLEQSDIGFSSFFQVYCCTQPLFEQAQICLGHTVDLPIFHYYFLHGGWVIYLNDMKLL